MIYSIINNLLPYFTTLNFADRVAGIAYPIELPIMDENNATILKRFPVIENSTKNQCDGNDYVSLVPDDSLKSLIYHELISDRIDEDNDSYQQHTATVRLVAWFNLRNINQSLTNCEQLLQLINNKIPFQIADFGTAYRITCETTDKRIRDKSIFSQWTYSESEKQYLIYPFDFGHLTLQISYRLNKCAESIVLDPNPCNDLKAKPFATVYDGAIVEQLSAGDVYTCTPCDTINIKNSDDSYDINTNLDTVLPDVNLTEWDLSVTVYPSVKNLACKIPGANLIYNFNGVLMYTLTPEQSLTINNSNVKNSDGSYNVDILAEGSLVLPDITVTNPITGETYPYPAAKNLTESLSKKIKLGFKATYDDTQDYDITAEEAGTYTGATLVNCTAVYKINDVVASFPLTFVNTNKYTAVITRTNAALDASVTIYT